MSQIPRVALFRPEDELDETLKNLFRKNEFSVRVVANPKEAENLVTEEAASFDTIVIPQQLFDGTGGTAACIQCKSNETLAGVPILAVSPSKEPAVLRSLYGAGADVVLSLPIDGDSFYLQIASLSRMQRNFQELVNKTIHDTGLLHPVVNAFHSMREGFLLFNPNFSLVFANQSAQAILGLPGDASEEAFLKVTKQFKPILKEHDATFKLAEYSQFQGPPTSTCDVTLTQLDHNTFRTILTISSVVQAREKLIGFSVALTNLAEIHHLGNTLVQAQRTRSLCMTMSAATLRLMEQHTGGLIVSPFKAIEDLLASSPRFCSLDQSLTSLLEILDLVVNPSLIIRVKVAQNLNVAISSTDFFVMMGHIVLHAVEHAGINGEISIASSENVPGEGVTVTISSESQANTPFVQKDEISQLIRSDFTNVSSIKDLADKFSFGLYASQRIAEKYRTTVEYQESAETEIKIRIRLPVSSGVTN